jgi:arylformamidase
MYNQRQMIISIRKDSRVFEIETDNPIDISIPLDFSKPQPNIYGVEKATSEAFEDEHFIGDTRRGGSCNFENIRLNTHCNGTHTECVGHITDERISVNECLNEAFLLADLITVLPMRASEINDKYSVELNEEDFLITKQSLEILVQNPKTALVIRTLPNDSTKLNRQYLQNPPPFFSTDAMELIAELGIRHLLVDLPSIDRLHDEGKLANHRIFWNIEQNSREITSKTYINNTITEMIFVPNEIEDGEYLLNLQIAPFVSDASPSRPVLFKFL